MSFGKMNTLITISKPFVVKDNEGFSVKEDRILATVRAYREDKNSTERWVNRASIADVSAMFRFRFIPNVCLDADCVIMSDGDRFNIVSVENVRRRNMYYEVMAKKEQPQRSDV